MIPLGPIIFDFRPSSSTNASSWVLETSADKFLAAVMRVPCAPPTPGGENTAASVVIEPAVSAEQEDVTVQTELPAVAGGSATAPQEATRTTTRLSGYVLRGVLGQRGTVRLRVLTALEQLSRRAGSPDWDGAGAAAVSPGAIAWAKQLLVVLPVRFGVPDVDADSDGEVTFTWYGDQGGVFAISVAPDGRLSYAGTRGGDRVHGREHFAGELSETIVSSLRRMASRESDSTSPRGLDRALGI